MSKIFPTSRFKGMDPKNFDLNKAAAIVKNVVF